MAGLRQYQQGIHLILYLFFVLALLSRHPCYARKFRQRDTFFSLGAFANPSEREIPLGPTAAPVCSNPLLSYFGGPGMCHEKKRSETNTHKKKPVIPNVEVWVVFWNSSVQYQSELPGFYTSITNSTYFDWLNE
jgi:hypothetical protein